MPQHLVDVIRIVEESVPCSAAASIQLPLRAGGWWEWLGFPGYLCDQRGPAHYLFTYLLIYLFIHFDIFTMSSAGPHPKVLTLSLAIDLACTSMNTRMVIHNKSIAGLKCHQNLPQ